MEEPSRLQSMGSLRVGGVFLLFCLCFWASLVAQLIKNLPAMQEDPGLIPGLGRSPGEGNGYPLQYSGLENSMDCIIHGVTKRLD